MDRAYHAKSLTSTQLALMQRADAFEATNPRVLFRWWHASSGGDSRLNTIDAITPRAFFDEPGHCSLYELLPSRICTLVDYHLQNRKSGGKTVFSSWSQSLAFVLAWAMADALHNPTAHISILDTRNLEWPNVVLHTSHINNLANRNGKSHDVEFLAYGKISGANYKAVPVKDFVQYASANWSLSVPGRFSFKNIGEHIAEEAIRVAKNFGPRYTQVVAAHLLATLPPAHRETVFRKLRLMDPPPGLYGECDASIMHPEKLNFFSLGEAAKAAEMLRDLAKYYNSNRQYQPKLSPFQTSLTQPSAGHRAYSEEAAEKETEQKAMPVVKKPAFNMSLLELALPQTSTPEKSTTATDDEMSSEELARLPKEVRKLYIDLTGWRHIIKQNLELA